jgi:hypothetical protein
VTVISGPELFRPKRWIAGLLDLLRISLFVSELVCKVFRPKYLYDIVDIPRGRSRVKRFLSCFPPLFSSLLFFFSLVLILSLVYRNKIPFFFLTRYIVLRLIFFTYFLKYPSSSEDYYLPIYRAT